MNLGNPQSGSEASLLSNIGTQHWTKQGMTLVPRTHGATAYKAGMAQEHRAAAHTHPESAPPKITAKNKQKQQ